MARCYSILQKKTQYTWKHIMTMKGFMLIKCMNFYQATYVDVAPLLYVHMNKILYIYHKND